MGRTNKAARRRAKQRKMILIAVEVMVLLVLVVVAVAIRKNDSKPEAPVGARWEEKNGSRYYLDAQGNALTGWQTIDSNRYYFAPEKGGAMAAGWADLENGTYYFGTDGVMRTGWTEVEGTRYYLGSDGILRTGWQEIDGSRYYLDSQGKPQTGWVILEDTRYFLNENGAAQTGWLDYEGSRYYLDDSGAMRIGWLQLGDDRYYLNETGAMHTGWLEQNGSKYYLKADGAAAKGKIDIEGKIWYFTSTGANVLLVNRWNELPKDYVPETLVKSKYNTQFDCQMTPEAVAALDAMIKDCKDAGFSPLVRTGYRSYGYQQALLDNKMNKGFSYEEAIMSVAIPGTSEHQSGLAVDISDSNYTNLNREQGSLPIQQWLREHCHEYGFIVRYPDGTTERTGIIYESWHYRYVGVELATELHALDICLEEYLDNLTEDGTTCGDPSYLA